MQYQPHNKGPTASACQAELVNKESLLAGMLYYAGNNSSSYQARCRKALMSEDVLWEKLEANERNNLLSLGSWLHGHCRRQQGWSAGHLCRPRHKLPWAHDRLAPLQSKIRPLIHCLASVRPVRDD